MTTIKLKNGSGAPAGGDLVQGEPALDLTNKRLYTENASGTVIEVGTNPGVDVTFADNRKAIFGAGSDLQIYHDGSNSYISEAGTGNLIMGAGAALLVKNAALGENLLTAYQNGAVTAYYDNAAKLATTSTGIDVTGTVTADGLTVDGATALNNTSAGTTVATLSGQYAGSGDVKLLEFQRNGGAVAGAITYADASTGMEIGTTTSHTLALTTGDTQRLRIGNNGNISFYEDTGSTAKLFWDASAESLGIGTSSPSSKLSVSNAGAGGLEISPSYSGTRNLLINYNRSASAYTGIDFDATDYIFYGSGSERMRIDSSGNVGIGTSTAGTLHGASYGTTQLHIDGKADRGQMLIEGDTLALIGLSDNGATADSRVFLTLVNDGVMTFKSVNDNGTTKANIMSLTSAGNVGIGTSSINRKLEISGNNNAGAKANYIRITDTDTSATANNQQGGIEFYTSDSGNENVTASIENLYSGSGAGSNLTFNTAPNGASGVSERMRIDSTGNLYSQTTTLNVGTSSTETGMTHQAGQLQVSANGYQAAIFNRLQDGTIADFRVDGAVVGSIGVDNSIPYFLRTAGGIAIGNTALLSVDSSGTINDNAYDLGGSSNRFKDLYLSGGLRGDTTFKNNAGTTEYARFNSSGNLQVGHTNTDNSRVSVEAGSAGVAMHFRRNTATYTTSAVVGSITCDSISTGYNTSSDQRLKENIVDAPSASDDIDAIQVRSFDWKADGSHQKYGMVAQELNTVAPEAVSAPEDPEEMMGVDYSKLVPMLVKEIQSLRARVAQLEGAN